MHHTRVWFNETGSVLEEDNAQQLIKCEKYNARVFLPVGAKGTSKVTQTAQFILRGLIQIGERIKTLFLVPLSYLHKICEMRNTVCDVS